MRSNFLLPWHWDGSTATVPPRDPVCSQLCGHRTGSRGALQGQDLATKPMAAPLEEVASEHFPQSLHHAGTEAQAGHPDEPPLQWCQPESGAGTGTPNPSRNKSGQHSSQGLHPAWAERCCGCSAQPCPSCSAGIGRTGCFIATRIGCQQLKDTGEVDILGIVCHLRIDRSVLGARCPSRGAAGCRAWEGGQGGAGGMIQTSEQYQFLHHTLALYASQLPEEGGH
ncbi:Tyrosine-protein phosphatase non-receptor type 7-like protein [Aix galericulata]|nr:Tyrosine-protein phosphatase non-receptor type 7-like protein [Aix galericulata]